MSFVLTKGIDRRRLLGIPIVFPNEPNPLNMVFTGFTTDPSGPADGQRPQANQFHRLYPGGDFLIWAWDQMGWGGDKAILECKALLDVIEKGNDRGAYTHILSSGHSFGGAFLIFFLNWLRSISSSQHINLARFIDPVSNPFDDTPWTIPLGECDILYTAMQFTQHNGMGFGLWVGPNGTIISNPGIVSLEFPWEAWPTINHATIPADPRVWNPSLAMMQAVVEGK